MPAYRFSWKAFDDTTVRSLAEAWGYSGLPAGARSWLEDKVKRPTPEFVRETKDALVRSWLPGYAGAGQIVDRLIDAGVGPMRNPRSPQGYARYVEDCRNSKRVRDYLLEALLRYGDADSSGDEGAGDVSFTPRFAILEVGKQTTDGRKPHAYQEEAWDRLSAHLAESKSTAVFQGLLVMPTGSGKTYTAVRWLASKILSGGMRVLWLAHRQELLGHAAAEFHRLAGYARPKERLRVRIVSGAHCATTQIDPADDVVVASVHSLARRPDITQQLLSDPRLFLVIDEAHHAPAKSYRDIIDGLKERKPWSMLGLTATPTRTIEAEKPLLTRLFGGRVISQVELGRLIEQKILARPIPVVVKTGSDVEAEVTEADREHLNRFQELSEEWLDRIARLSARNALVIKHYLENKAKYGPTLIFAINVAHAALLADDLTRMGIRADYVASYRPDGTDRDPLAVIQQFRQGHLDVLVNVQMVTEGVDVPSVQTVFLTRPTNSEIAMRQMIGRALRGPAAGGSTHAYLVSFEDHWEQFSEWDSPFALVPDIRTIGAAGEEEEIEAEPKTERTPDLPDRFYEHLPWETIRTVAAALGNGIELKADAFEAVPDGWLVLERSVDDDFLHIPIALYQHQKGCWNALMDHLGSLSVDARLTASAEALYDEYFDDCDDPRPSRHQVEQVVEHFRAGAERPEMHDLAGREACDPYKVAERIHTQNLGRRETAQLIEASYTGLARAIYPHLREYHAAIDDALFEIDHPDEATRSHRAVPVFTPRPEDQLAPGPTHDLATLMAEVLVRGAELLGVPELKYDGELSWSRRILKGWFGMAYLQATPKRIRINKLLDSPDINPDTMRFLLWHESLHIHLSQGHTKTFRDLERRWPGMVDADRQLLTLNERFGVSYW